MRTLTSAAATLALVLCTPAVAGELRPPLDEVLRASDPASLVPVSIVLNEQVDAPRLRLAAAGLSKREGRRAALELLKRTAAATQAPLLAHARRLEGQGRVARIRPLWIGNVVGLDATPDVIRELARRPEVAWINHNPKVDVFLGRRAPDALAGALPGPLSLPADTTAEIECGTALLNAPQVWNDLGVTGQGAVVAVIDTGVCWTHPDIAQQIWVNPGEDLDQDGVVMDAGDENGVDDDGNGFVDDLIGWDFDFGDNEPEDTNQHGSHCAGSVAGDGASGTQAGVAPDAKIMVVKVGVTFADEVDVWSGMQYAADNGADAISMSLGWPHGNSPDRPTWRQNCENTIEAGTAMVIAAGNEGSGNEPDNVRTPGDVPRVITVGALDCADVAAGFSSRGPVTWQGVPGYDDHPYPPGLVKPDVAGPGVSTKSHSFCSGYSFLSGTSMATPHVAGAVALMVAANPGVGHDDIKQVLEATSVELGDPGKDTTYGTGRVDAFAAVNEVFGLTLEQVTVLDGDLDVANADGGIDTGEIVTVLLTLKNNQDVPATGIRGTISTDTPGVTLVHDWARWPDAPGQALVESVAPHVSLRIDSGCNTYVDVTLVLEQDGGRISRSRFRLRTGSPFDRTLLDDDFEADLGWTAGGSSATGTFERADPRFVKDAANNPVQPDDDVTPAPGTLCWVTGNDDRQAGDDDVDAGTSSITSPMLDATNFDSATVRFSRWYYAFPATLPASDFFRAQWSRDGVSWSSLEELVTGEPAWQAVALPLPPSAFGPGLRIRFEAEDQASVPLNSIVEALIDEVTLDGVRYECDLFTPPVVLAPNAVGNTLLVTRQSDDVRLDWTAPPVDGGHAAATLYRVYRSGGPGGGFSVSGLSTEPFHVDVDAAAGSAADAYYLVASENGGGASGEAP